MNTTQKVANRQTLSQYLLHGYTSHYGKGKISSYAIMNNRGFHAFIFSPDYYDLTHLILHVEYPDP